MFLPYRLRMEAMRLAPLISGTFPCLWTVPGD